MKLRIVHSSEPTALPSDMRISLNLLDANKLLRVYDEKKNLILSTDSYKIEFLEDSKRENIIRITTINGSFVAK